MNLDFILNGKATGSVAQRLMANGMKASALRPFIGDDGRAYISVYQGGKQVNQLVANATLRRDEWVQIDQAIIPAARFRLRGVADLYSRGLVYRIGNGLGKTVLEYEDLSELTPAEMTMDGVNRVQKDRPVYDTKYLPLPIVHKDWSYNARVLAASRTTGDPLDTTTAELATRQVAEFLEDMLFNGTSLYAFGGGTIYGYTDFPQRNQLTLDADWDESGVDGADILADVKEMKQASLDARHYGPWVLYVPSAYETVLDGDYLVNYPKTIRQRILELDGITDIRISDVLSKGSVLLVQMDPSVIRMVEGMPIQNLEWNAEGGLVYNFKVMTIQVPQIRADQYGHCGITHMKKA